MLDVHFEHLLLVDSRGGVTAVTAAPSLAWILPVCGPATVGLYEDSILVMESHLFVRRRGSRYACPLDWTQLGLYWCPLVGMLGAHSLGLYHFVSSSMPYVLE